MDYKMSVGIKNLCNFFVLHFGSPTSNVLVFVDIYLHNRHKKEGPWSVFSPTILFKLKKRVKNRPKIS